MLCCFPLRDIIVGWMAAFGIYIQFYLTFKWFCMNICEGVVFSLHQLLSNMVLPRIIFLYKSEPSGNIISITGELGRYKFSWKFTYFSLVLTLKVNFWNNCRNITLIDGYVKEGRYSIWCNYKIFIEMKMQWFHGGIMYDGFSLFPSSPAILSVFYILLVMSK